MVSWDSVKNLTTTTSSNSATWNGQVYLSVPPGAPSQATFTLYPAQGVGTITDGLIKVSSNTWQEFKPKPDAIWAVLITEDNIEQVAKSLVKQGGRNVKVYSDYVTYSGDTFAVGDWLVREWDYRNGEYKFRPASLSEREKYDLR